MDIFNDKRKLAIIGLSALLAIIIALILWWFLRPKPAINVNTNTAVNTEIPVTTAEPALVEPATPAQVKEANSYPLGLKQLAMAFAERYGSYSTDEPQKSIADLAPYMTARLSSELSAGSADALKSSVFTGFTTKALSTSLTSVSDARAEIIVKVQRTQTIDRAAKTFYADLKLTALKTGNDWKIDSAAWQ